MAGGVNITGLGDAPKDGNPQQRAEMITVVRVVLTITKREWFDNTERVVDIQKKVAAKATDYLNDLLTQNPQHGIAMKGEPTVVSVTTEL